jgi:hypothetical protein
MPAGDLFQPPPDLRRRQNYIENSYGHLGCTKVNDYLAPTFHVLPLTVIRRERKLPFPGKILVRKGQKVGANDAVVEAKLSPKHLMLDIAMGLSVSRTRSERFIRVKTAIVYPGAIS